MNNDNNDNNDFKIRFYESGVGDYGMDMNLVSYDRAMFIAHKLYGCPINELVKRIDEPEDGIYVSTELPKKHWYQIYRQHILNLDCDSEVDMLRAVEDLKKLNITYCRIQSTPGHYWIVCDKIGSISELYKFALNIAGVDRNYLYGTIDKRKFIIRAYPKKTIPLFIDSFTVGSIEFKEWLAEFKRYWSSEDMSWVASQISIAIDATYEKEN